MIPQFHRNRYSVEEEMRYGGLVAISLTISACVRTPRVETHLPSQSVVKGDTVASVSGRAQSPQGDSLADRRVGTKFDSLPLSVQQPRRYREVNVFASSATVVKPDTASSIDRGAQAAQRDSVADWRVRTKFDSLSSIVKQPRRYREVHVFGAPRNMVKRDTVDSIRGRTPAAQ